MVDDFGRDPNASSRDEHRRSHDLCLCLHVRHRLGFCHRLEDCGRVGDGLYSAKFELARHALKKDKKPYRSHGLRHGLGIRHGLRLCLHHGFGDSHRGLLVTTAKCTNEDLINDPV
jgi:hypothetical protein